MILRKGFPFTDHLDFARILCFQCSRPRLLILPRLSKQVQMKFPAADAAEAAKFPAADAAAAVVSESERA